jgi:hypothetical protein
VSVAVESAADVGVLLGVGTTVFVGVGMGVLSGAAVLLDAGALVTCGSGIIEGVSDSTDVDVVLQVDVGAGITGGVPVIRRATRCSAVSAIDPQTHLGTPCTGPSACGCFLLISECDGEL